MKRIEGVCPMMAAPFDKAGKVDFKEFETLIDYLLTIDVQGIGLFGMAGEFFKLTDNERNEMAALFTSKTKDTDIFGLVNVTDHCTEIAVERAQAYEDMGADCLMVLPPHFLHPSTQKVMKHLKAVAGAVKIPVMIQYTPNETGQELPPEEIVAIRQEYPNVIYKVENTPPTEYSKKILGKDKDAIILNGYWGIYLLDMLAIGGKGVMPGCSFSEIYIATYNAFHAGDMEKATRLHSKLVEYITVRWNLEYERLLAVEKEILRYRGIISNAGVRNPVYDIADTDHRLIKEFLKDFREVLPQ